MGEVHPTYRVEWLPGSDILRGRCGCGATARAQDPATLLDWLDAHAPRRPGEDWQEAALDVDGHG